VTRNSMWTSLTTILVVVVVAVVALGLGARPRLGLDLQGGISAVYTPVFDTDEDLTEAQINEALDQTIEVIRNRVDSLGVAEPEISRLGTDINVQLPGVADADRANDIIGRTAQLTFWPVEELLVPGLPGYTDTPPCVMQDEALDGTTFYVLNPERPQPEDGVVCGDVQLDADTTAGATGSETPSPGTSIAPSDGATDGATGSSAPAEPASPSPAASPAVTETTTESAAIPGPDVQVVAAQETTTSEAPSPSVAPTDATPAPSDATPAPTDVPTDVQTINPEDIDDGLPAEAPRPLKYRLGPAPTDGDGDVLSGDDIQDANAAALGQELGVSLDFDADGEAAFQAITAQLACERDQGQPGQLAIVLDGVVESAPNMSLPSGGDRGVICDEGISGGASITTGDQASAEDLALVLRAGALPITLEPATFETVSPTLGASSLRNGLIAGLVGLLLVGLYLLYFYRVLGAIAIGALLVFGALVMGAITAMGRFGFALSLAGVAGIIVSVGITADSSIIYFERIRDEVAVGKTTRLAVSRGFDAAFRTNLSGNTVTLVAALILYFLAVGPVRGFAFTLGLSTLLDLVIMWAFTRSVVGLLAFRGKLGSSIRRRQAATTTGATEPRGGMA